MHSNAKRRFFWMFTVAAVLSSAACTLLLDRSAEQCSNNDECAKYGAGSVCSSDNVCTKPEGADTGPQQDGQADVADTGTDVSDAGFEAFGHDGCVLVAPSATTTNEEFLNACTRAQFSQFDNCGKLGLCDGGLLGANPPEGGAPPAPPGPDSGASEFCTDVAAQNGASPIYVTGSSNFPPFLRAVAPVLAANSPSYGVVWQTSSSCAGVDAIYNDFSDPTPDPTKKIMKERPGRTSEYYLPDGGVKSCVINGDVVADVGESDIYGSTCSGNVGYNPTSPNVGEYLGPTMAMVFIAPQLSTQAVISAEAAQAVFGRGSVPDTTKLPWDAPTQFFIRASSTATNQIISRGIFVEPTKWWGSDKSTAGNMANQMKTVPPALAEKTIGIISTDFADNERGNIKTLAFQAKDQAVGFWPDSTPFAEDKANVRDGHYPLWGPLHFFVRLDINGQPATPAAGAFVLRFSIPKLDQALVKGIVDSHNVPACAMRVTRDVEMGPIKNFEPPYYCDCFFDNTATGSTACKACPLGPSECTDPARPACNYGFCEPR